ncbi:MAG: D-alanyl-D-alanine carboxypeptidase [Spirochaetes bacterium]|nr:D-alanyl-D-alanine carboxypeptidase [Spirochaetota bacterium]
MFQNKSKLIVIILLFFCFSLKAADFRPAPPELYAHSAILFDVNSGFLLFEKNADDVIPPASMTKLMTMHIVFNAIREGRLSLDQYIPISAEASFKSSPPRSSLMFIEEGQIVTLFELMKGLAIPSGNDAAVAVAEAVAGSVPAFISMMNREARRMGLEQTFFDDASGFSAYNKTTAREFARFCFFYIQENPEAIPLFHSFREFTYPLSHNIPEGSTSALGPIGQFSNNILLGRVEGVDGLKTGFIYASGFNIALTAERDGRRLLAVLMGGPRRNGAALRARDGEALLSYGFDNYTTFYPQLPELSRNRVYKGRAKNVELTVMVPAITLPNADVDAITWEIEWGAPLVAPFPAGTEAGMIRLLDKENSLIFSRSIVTAIEVERGSFFRRFFDSIALFFKRIFAS